MLQSPRVMDRIVWQGRWEAYIRVNGRWVWDAERSMKMRADETLHRAACLASSLPCERDACPWCVRKMAA